MLHARSKSFLLVLTLLALFVSVDRAEAASLTFTPSSASLKQACLEQIDMIVDTRGDDTNAGDAIVLYNPSEVEIIDQNAGLPGIQVKPGTAYQIYAGNVVNEAQGKIFLTAFSVMGSFNGSGLYGSIFFKTKPGVTSTSFSFDFTPGQSIDSNIADTNGNDILASVNTGNYTFSASPCIPDTQAPSVTNVVPANGATNVALSTNVSFQINDNQSGVDLSTLQIQLHNVGYSEGSSQVAISGLPLNYTVTIDPDENFPGGTEIVLVVQAKDLVGNTMSPKVYSFNKPVVVPPPAVPVCGNGIIEGDEECEPANSLVCDSTCQVVVSVCVAGAPGGESIPGSGIIEDGTTVGGTTTGGTTTGGTTEGGVTTGGTTVGGTTVGGTTTGPNGEVIVGGVTVGGITTGGTTTGGTTVDGVTTGGTTVGGITEGGTTTGGTMTQGPTLSFFGSSQAINTFYDGFSDTLTSFLSESGLAPQPQQVAGVNVAQLALESFVCSDNRIDLIGTQRKETPYTPPAGYELLRDPFSLNCAGPHETTLALPQEYTNVKAIKCVGGNCSDISVSQVQNVQCGQQNIVVQETSLAQQEADIQNADLERVSFDPSRYRIEDLANARNGAYRIERFTADYQSKLHTSLKLLSTPVRVARVASTAPSVESVRVILPFVADPEVETKSTQIYAYDTAKKLWQVLSNSTVQTADATISANLDYQKYADANGDAVFAVFGVVCPGCEQSQFNLAYQPSVPSRAAVVLIHGIEGSVNDWLPILGDIRQTKQPWQVWTYDFPATRPLPDSARSLAAELQIHADDYDVVYLIAHGTGGLLAQQAVTYAHREQAINPNQFSVVGKIKKVVLIGVPNDPLPSENLILTYYNYLVNSGAGHLFDLKNSIISDLLQQKLPIAQVPGVKYFVIAGNKGLEATGDLATASLFEGLKNDGLVSVASAQHVGGAYLNQQCTNYWEIGASHLELLQNNSARLAIGRLISQDLSRDVQEQALLGHEQYFRLADASCSPEDSYLLIGQKTQREKLPDPLGCSCGNGYCGTDEDSVSCPIDCDNFFRKENFPLIYGTGSLLLLIILILSGTAIIRRLLKGKSRIQKADKKKDNDK